MIKKSKPKPKHAAKKKAAPRPAKPKQPTPDTLPRSLINALPVAAQMMKHFGAAYALVAQLEKELKAAEKRGAIPMARAFVTFHRMKQRLDEMDKPIFGQAGLFDRAKVEVIPTLFQAEGIRNVPLEEGFRVQLSSKLFARIKGDEDPQKAAELREQAHQWLRDNGLGDIIQTTINAQTLSAAAKSMIEEQNKELPSALFTVELTPNTSVVKL